MSNLPFCRRRLRFNSLLAAAAITALGLLGLEWYLIGQFDGRAGSEGDALALSRREWRIDPDKPVVTRVHIGGRRGLEAAGNEALKDWRRFRNQSTVGVAGKNVLSSVTLSSSAPETQSETKPRPSSSSAPTLSSIATRFNPLALSEKDLDVLKRRKTAELRLRKNEREQWWYVKAGLSDLERDANVPASVKKRLKALLQGAEEHHFSISAQAGQLEQVGEEGLTLGRDWRVTMARELSKTMFKRLQFLQNPADCNATRKLVCNIKKHCGFGCQIHHLAFCFITAYATNRLLVIDSRMWKYASQHGWDGVFLPLTPCTINYQEKWTDWSVRNMNLNQTLFLPVIESVSPILPQHPPAIPRDMADELRVLHGFPFSWFLGHFLKYLMRPSVQLQQYIEKKRREMGFQRPIVGVHIRRTDKLYSEASFHPLEEYMTQVEEWFKLDAHATNASEARRVFIASDDPKLFKEARTNYSEYQFLGNTEASVLAHDVSKSRYSLEALFGIVFDVLMLSECDYIVCTFSSQVCRLAYELMQTNQVDASQNFYSLDDVYYYGGQQPNLDVALHSHKAASPGELSFEAGDLIGIAGNLKNGWSVGATQKKRHIRGKFPSFKVEGQPLVADFPTYPEAVPKARSDDS